MKTESAGLRVPSPCQCCGAAFSRREFLAVSSAAIGGVVLSGLAQAAAAAEAAQVAPMRRPLVLQPVLVYDVPQRQEKTSWRGWGAIQTEAQATEEVDRITRELNELKAKADFPMEFRPVVRVKDVNQAAELAKADHDGILDYAAGGWGNIHEALINPAKWNIMFVRHRSGPVSLWYEIAHNRFLRKTVDEFGQPGMDVMDVVVDQPGELMWRLRALYGLKNTMGKKIVALGGASGWGHGGRTAPDRTRELWNMEIVDFPYPELGKLVQQAQADEAVMKHCRKMSEDYLADKSLTLKVDKDAVERSFVLTEVLKNVLAAAGTDAFTINACMGTIMQVTGTTACLSLSLLNDAGYLAFCESDFVVVPSGVLLHYISGKPQFLNDPTYPYNRMVTLAHCTAPRKMDGAQAEPTDILTHFESDFGASPKVNMRKGQVVTNLIPDFASKNWVGCTAEIVDNPYLDICRSQIDVHLNADTETLLRKMGGFHWMTCYGDYLKETGYALKKRNVEFQNLSRPAMS